MCFVPSYEEGGRGAVRTRGVLPSPLMTLGPPFPPLHVLQMCYCAAIPPTPRPPALAFANVAEFVNTTTQLVGLRGARLGKGNEWVRVNDEEAEGWTERLRAALV